MEETMRGETKRGIVSAFALAAVVAGGYRYIAAQTGAGPREPFKLGTFERGGRAFIGVVLRDAQVIHLSDANAALESRTPAGTKVRMPADMKELIERYDTDLKGRLYAIVNDVAGAQTAPPYVHPIKDLRALPPVRPALILNAGGNYEEHAQGIAQQQARASGAQAAAAPAAVSAPGIWERKPGDPRRENPYLFMKSPTVVIGAHDPIRMPAGRTQIDFECEFDAVVGRPANHVPIARRGLHLRLHDSD
jgi:2-keto-4-pentenoate hydratase/2-oxohepta-3-ene-1,7-dioic acid hydratase in catechol pathway